jgi:hypothetical protein
MQSRTWMLALALLLSVAVSPAAAQNLELGFSAGPTFSSLSGLEDLEDEEFGNVSATRVTGIGLGAFLRAGSGNAALQVEVNYVQRGGGIELNLMGFNGSSQLELDYLEVPVLLRLALPAGTVSPFLFAGPAASFELGCSMSISLGGFEESGDCDDVDEEMGSIERRKLDVAALVGGGVGFPLGAGNLLFQARYSLGLLDLNESENGDVSIKNRSFSLSAGFALPLGR